jgi:hypothetical protein
LQRPGQQLAWSAMNDQLPQCDQKRYEKDRAKPVNRFQNRMGTSIFVDSRKDRFCEKNETEKIGTGNVCEKYYRRISDSIIEND